MSRTRSFRRCFSIPAIIAIVCASASGLQAQDPAQRVQREHTVRTGDTLWDLARLYFGNPFLWPLIFDANRPVVENPHRIFPAEKLIIPGRDTARMEPLGTPVPPPEPQAPIVVTVQPLDTPATAVAMPDNRRFLVTEREYATAPWLSPTPRAHVVGRMVRVADPSVVADKIPITLQSHMQVAIGDLHGSFESGDSIQIVRFGRTIGRYGTVVQPLGVLRIDSVRPTVVVATLVQHFGDARIGDYVMALTTQPEMPRGVLEPVAAGPVGRLLEFVEPEPLQGPGDLAFVTFNAGDVRIGDELAVYTPETKIDVERPEVLPESMVGTMTVIKVVDRLATVRVSTALNTGLRAGLSARLVRRAP